MDIKITPQIFLFFIFLPIFSCQEQTVYETDSPEFSQKGDVLYLHWEPFTGMAMEIHPMSGEEMMSKYVEGLKQGEWISYHPNGALMSKINYQDGKEYGDEIPIIMTCQTG